MLGDRYPELVKFFILFLLKKYAQIKSPKNPVCEEINYKELVSKLVNCILAL